jgi:pSer/pThr/pTyr-binding forkhead associated (FHA) protein
VARRTRPDCDLVVDRPEVSARHCRLSETAHGFILHDLGSSNGTYVNGSASTALSRQSVITDHHGNKLVPFGIRKKTAAEPPR